MRGARSQQVRRRDLPLPELIERAAAPYRAAGRFAWHFARGKLRWDPVFADVLRIGLIPSGCHILDLGCGRGLLAAWLQAAQACHDEGLWPDDQPPPPQSLSLRGIDRQGRDIRCAQTLGYATAVFEEGDIYAADLGHADVAVIWDVMHFLTWDRQETILRRVKTALGPNGLLLLRIGNGRGGWRYRLSQWNDWLMAALRGQLLRRLYGRSIEGWLKTLTQLGFTVDHLPMNGTMPFANILLVARLGPGAHDRQGPVRPTPAIPTVVLSIPRDPQAGGAPL